MMSSPATVTTEGAAGNGAMTKTSDQSFDKDVLKSGQPVLVDFWAEWCGPCKMIAPMLDEIARERAGRVKIVKVNIDWTPAIADRFGIHAVPTLFFFANGEVRDRLVGVVSKRAILFRLERLTAAA